jgi:drug/metabolite transporter (DMT)-like permease
MALASLALLLAAAGFHAAANTLIKRAHDKLAFAWWMLGVSSILGLPLCFLIGNVDPPGWLFVLTSGLLEAIYFVALTRAYALGDLSQVYPIARGSAQPFTVLWGFLFLGERPSPVGLLGVAVIVAGLYFVNLPSRSDWKRPLLGFRRGAARWALLTGFLISAYSAVDKQGVKFFDPIIYIYLILLVSWIALTPQWFSSARRVALIREMQSGEWDDGCLHFVTTWPAQWHSGRAITIIAAGLFGVVAYVLVLAALRISPVSYVGPAREVSVVIGSWIGIRFLGEPGGALRVAASALVAVGVLLIAISG